MKPTVIVPLVDIDEELDKGLASEGGPSRPESASASTVGSGQLYHDALSASDSSSWRDFNVSSPSASTDSQHPLTRGALSASSSSWRDFNVSCPSSLSAPSSVGAAGAVGKDIHRGQTPETAMYEANSSSIASFDLEEFAYTISSEEDHKSEQHSQGRSQGQNKAVAAGAESRNTLIRGVDSPGIEPHNAPCGNERAPFTSPSDEAGDNREELGEADYLHLPLRSSSAHAVVRATAGAVPRPVRARATTLSSSDGDYSVSAESTSDEDAHR
jgi:hypothetical protein